MKNVILSALLVLFAVSAQADGGYHCPSWVCSAPPQEPFSFASASEAFQYGSSPWPQDLVGGWSEVASTQNPSLYPVQVVTEESNDQGIALDPGHPGLRGVFTFNVETNDFGVHTVQVGLRAVDRETQSEVASLDQGPVVASLGMYESCFAFAYGKARAFGSQGYMDYSCRTLRSGNLLCSMKLHPNYGEDVAGYTLLKRVF